MKKEKFNVSGMSCAACQSHVQKAVISVSGVKSAQVNLLTNSMVVEYDESQCSAMKIEEAVEKAGYHAECQSSGSEAKGLRKKPEKDDDLIRLILSFAFLIAVMYFSMGNMMWGWWAPEVFDHKSSPVGNVLVQLLLTIPVIALNIGYFKRGIRKLFAGKPNMDSLIAIGSGVSLIYGIFALFMMVYAESSLAGGALTAAETENFNNILMRFHESIYFESAAMILTLVSLGKFLEKKSKKKTTVALEKLVSLAPETALVERGNEEIEIDAKDVVVGETIILKRGMIAPVDGVVISGTASVKESSITGEPLPAAKETGDQIYSSSVVESGYLKVRAVKVGEDTSISRVIKLVEEASNSKAPISKLADKISGIFVPIIFAISILTLIINLFVSHSFDLSLNFAITVVVIACPCALGLATPVAIMVGTGKGAENGLLIKNAEIMERVNSVKTIVFDKTGTITEGNPTVTSYKQYSSDKNLLSYIYSLESISEHPLARAIIDYCKTESTASYPVQNFKALDGLGICGTINSHEVYIGNIKLMESLGSINLERKTEEEELAKSANIPLFVALDGQVAALICIKDKVKETSAMAIKLLRKMNIKTIMLTGDNEKTAEVIAREAGTDEFYAGVTPEEKLQKLNLIRQKTGNLVAMVGDGVNDAPALSGADLSIALGSGSDISIDTSDIVLVKNDLLDVVNVIRLSRRILFTIKLGLFWAFFYNLVCVLIATGIFYYPFGFKINPMIGSLAMSLSSVSVVLSALSINFFKPTKSKNVVVKNKIENKEVVMEFYVKGMMCNNCVNHVRTALETAGVKVNEINLDTKKVTVETKLSENEIFELVKNAGYDATKE